MPSAALDSLPLAELKTGEHAFLCQIEGGQNVLSRLSSLGFTPGVELEMTQNYGRGPVVVSLRGARVALGRQEAQRAFVRRSVA